MQDPALFGQLKPNFPEQEQLKCPRCDSPNTKFCYYNNYNLSQPRHFCKSCRRYWTKGGALRNIPVGGGSRKNTKRSSATKRAAPGPGINSSPSASSPPPPTPDPIPERDTVVGPGSNSDSGAGVQDSNRHNHQDENSTQMLGSFSSLLASSGQFGNLLDMLNSNGPGVKFVEHPSLGLNWESGLIRNQGLELQSRKGNGNGNGSSEGCLGSLQNSDLSCWQDGINGDGDGNRNENGNGWPDLSIYTPGSSFHLNH